jgi:hypothetical protein
LSVKTGPNSPDLLVKDWSEHRAKKTHQQVTTKGKQAGRKSEPATLTVSGRS